MEWMCKHMFGGAGPIPTIQELQAEEAKANNPESMFDDDAEGGT